VASDSPLPEPGDQTIRVEEATEATVELLEALRSLLPQLSSTAAELTGEELADLVAAPASILLVARDREGNVLGSLTLAVFRVPTGLRAWIEDVVVDESTRGRGVGAALTEAALERAFEAGCRSVDLTSRPSREAANRLYLRLGFEARTTNVYRRTLEAPT
jgi:ribosomal protein S18 acetylase RimI-like enzyme